MVSIVTFGARTMDPGAKVSICTPAESPSAAIGGVLSSFGEGVRESHPATVVPSASPPMIRMKHDAMAGRSGPE